MPTRFKGLNNFERAAITSTTKPRGELMTCTGSIAAVADLAFALSAPASAQFQHGMMSSAHMRQLL
jgi:hypothetical protein